MSYETIIFTVDGAVGIIQLNRPERMNAVVEEMYREIQDVLARAGADTSIRTLIITGSALKRGDTVKQAFCAGADLKRHSTGERTHAQKRAYIALAHETSRKIYQFPKPIIAAVNGPARGAGAEMAFNCDLIFMAENATIAFPEVSLGTFVGGGVTYLLPRIIGLFKARELIYTGRVIDGKAAVELGLAMECHPVESLLKEAKAFACALSEKAPFSLELAKKRLQDSSALDIDTVLLLEAEAILSCMDTEDWLEGVRAFAEKRKPVYRGK
jgi:enoyl-CoA hydratase